MIGDRLDDPLDPNPVSSKQQPSVNLIIKKVLALSAKFIGQIMITHHKNQKPLSAKGLLKKMFILNVVC